MAWSVDARIPIGIDPSRTGRQAALVRDGASVRDGVFAVAVFEDAPPHRGGCGCCGGRSGVAIALDRLFQARVRGIVPWFDGVLADPELADAVAAALRDDAVTAARFRAASPPPVIGL